ASRSLLPGLTREYTLNEIAIITRAGPARALGLRRKGHLGVGADADVAIYPDARDKEEMFERPAYVLKDGRIVVRDGEVVEASPGRTLYADIPADDRLTKEIGDLFQAYYTVEVENFPIPLEDLAGHEAIPVGRAGARAGESR
ncbi:MAG: amidohydrolase family protein, partial [Acidobacteriota bacterium]